MKIGVFALRMARMWLSRSDKKIYAKTRLPEGSAVVNDVDALSDGMFCHQIDVYHPAPEKRINKTVLDIHGGAYIYSNRKNNKAFAGVFLEKGFNVVTMDYPLNGKKGIDCRTQITVLAKQLRYVWDHAEELGLNREAFFLTGDSAGGHYCLLLAEMVCDPDLAASFGVDLSGIKLKAVAPSCPVYDFVRIVSDKRSLTKGGKRFMFGKTYSQEGFATSLCPKTHLSSLNIPLFLSSCTRDFLRQESLDLAEDLKATSLPHEFIFVESDDSAVNHIHNVVYPNHPESIRVNDAMVAFFLAHAE